MIRVNDREIEAKEGQTVSSVIKDLNYVFPMLVVRINGRLVARNRYDTTPIEDGDRVDIIHLVSGG